MLYRIKNPVKLFKVGLACVGISIPAGFIVALSTLSMGEANANFDAGLIGKGIALLVIFLFISGCLLILLSILQGIINTYYKK